MIEKTGKCIECASPTHAIKVLEYGDGNRHHQLKYAAADAKAGWFMGRFPMLGYLEAELCESCGRVTFRAVPSPTEE